MLAKKYSIKPEWEWKRGWSYRAKLRCGGWGVAECLLAIPPRHNSLDGRSFKTDRVTYRCLEQVKPHLIGFMIKSAAPCGGEN